MANTVRAVYCYTNRFTALLHAGRAHGVQATHVGDAVLEETVSQ